jgi:putative flippase GtrA
MSDLRGFLKQVITPGGSGSWKVQFFQHLVTGVVATAAHYIVMWFALNLQLWPVVATTIGFTAGATTRFFFSYFHIFEPERDVIKALPHFVLALSLQMVLNAALLALFLTMTTLVWSAQILTTGLLVVFNFLVYKFWVFK